MNLSRNTIIALVSVCAVCVGLYLFATHYEGKIDALRQENQKLSASYSETIGKSKAHEAAAAEEKLKNQALESAIEKGNQKVKDLGADYERIVKSYEAKKSTLNDCIDNDCTRQLCEDLRRAGFAVKCE